MVIVAEAKSRGDSGVLESVELSLIFFTAGSMSSFLDLDRILESRGIPSVITESPLPKFSASRTATHEPIKNINSPITLEAGVA